MAENKKDIQNEPETVTPEVNEKETESVDEKAEKKSKSKESKKEKELECKIEQLNEKLGEAKDMLLRTAAEYDNFKKRETANRDKTAAFIKCETIKPLLPVLDNITRAMSADESAPEYAKGVALTVKSLKDALTKMGLEEINPENEPFDVNLHQAVMRVEDDSVPENTVVQVLQPGYKMGDTVLRHAMVKVANCN